jgi:uncharacterized membrane protein
MLIVDLLARWAHVGAAIVLLGGAVFTRFVLLGAAAELPQDQHDALKARIRATWTRFVSVGILLLLLSGFYNFITKSIPQHKGDGLYHALMGTKILISFAVFFLASVLAGRSPRFEAWRQRPAKWLTILILLASVTAGIGSTLKVRSGVQPATVIPTPSLGPASTEP